MVLVEELEVVRVDMESLVSVMEEIIVVDVVGLGGIVVSFVGEGVVFGSCLRSLFFIKVWCCERLEVVIVWVYGFDDYEVGVGVIDGVDLYGFKEVFFGILYDSFVLVIEVVWEVVNRYVGVIDMIVVVIEEEIDVFIICD